MICVNYLLMRCPILCAIKYNSSVSWASVSAYDTVGWLTSKKNRPRNDLYEWDVNYSFTDSVIRFGDSFALFLLLLFFSLFACMFTVQGEQRKHVSNG